MYEANDEIGLHTEAKHIVMAEEMRNHLAYNADEHNIYFDGSSGHPQLKSETKDAMMESAAMIASKLVPGFNEIHLCEIEPNTVKILEKTFIKDSRVKVYQPNDTNNIIREVLLDINPHYCALGYFDPCKLLQMQLATIIEFLKHFNKVNIYYGMPVNIISRKIFNKETLDKFLGTDKWKYDGDSKTRLENFTNIFREIMYSSGAETVSTPALFTNKGRTPMFSLFSITKGIELPTNSDLFQRFQEANQRGSIASYIPEFKAKDLNDDNLRNSIIDQIILK